MADITEYISGSIIGKFQTLDGKPRKENVIAYVEGDDDIPFWTHIMSLYPNYSFVITPNRAYAVNGRYPNGKTALLNIPNLKKDKIICIDADLDLIVGKRSVHSKRIRICRYIINTQFYAIENVLSQAPLLKTIIMKVTGEDSEYDFERFMKLFSNAISDLFLLYLACIKSKRKKFSLEDFKNFVNRVNTSSNDIEKELMSFKQDYQNQLKNDLLIHRNSMIQYKQRLKSLGYKERDTYKLMQGHTLYNSIIRELLFFLCNNILKRKFETLIHTETNPDYKDLRHKVYGFLDAYDNKLRNYIDYVFGNNESVKNHIPTNLKSQLDSLYLY